jgi:hypothetical protein
VPLKDKEKLRLYRAQYYLDNRDQILNDCRQKYELNKAPYIERSKARYRTHESLLRSQRKVRYIKNKSHELEIQKIWAFSNPLQVKEIKKRYRDTHKGKIKAYNAQHRRSEATHYKLYKKEWRKTNGKRERLQSRYGISMPQFLEMLENQSHKCGICQDDLVVACVDHNHDTSEVRGLLCHKCNAGMGAFQDNSDTLQKALNWLTKAPYNIQFKRNVRRQIPEKICGICENDSKLCIDHDHNSGLVRGLLCGGCNRALGLLKDDKDIIKNAINWLRRPTHEDS